MSANDGIRVEGRALGLRSLQWIQWLRHRLGLVAELGKARIVSLLLLAAIGGAFLGEQQLPTFSTLLILVISGSLAAGGSSAINQYLERDLDRLMRRTRRRPLPSGAIAQPRRVLWGGLAAIMAAALMGLSLSPVLAACLLGGAFIYVCVYTWWLKPRSVLNIVIGGAAGSFAVLSGGAAVGGLADPAVLTLALVIFVWTPAHFWALAMVARSDYEHAGFPMLPARVSASASARWVAVHLLATVASAWLLGVSPSLGWLYLVPVAAFSTVPIALAFRLLREPSPKLAYRLFGSSNIFLAVVLGAILFARIGQTLAT